MTDFNNATQDPRISQNQNTDQDKKDRNQLVISYYTLRKYLGIMGLALPVIILIGSTIATKGTLESSISDYFHTPLRQFFTVSLSGISLFLIAYKGYNEIDRWLTNAAGVFGLLTTFVFTNFKDQSHLYGYVLATNDRKTIVDLSNLPGGPYEIIPSPVSNLQASLHITFAAIFFLLLAWMAFFQFTKAGKKGEKILYRVTGLIMPVTIIALIPGVIEKYEQFYIDHDLIFWGEFICLWSFGITWLVKGVSSQQRATRRKKRMDLKKIKQQVTVNESQ